MRSGDAGRRRRAWRRPGCAPHAYAELINAAIGGRPDDLAIAIHLCRGNYRSTWFAQGGYEPVAEVLFNELDVDAYFLEYDDERSGDFAPLRHVPADKTVVLGLITSKRPELESYDELAARIDEAGKFAPLDQLCLSPQCAVRQHGRGQRAHRGPAVGQARRRRRHRRSHLVLTFSVGFASSVVPEPAPEVVVR